MNIFLISRGFPKDNDPQWGNFEADQAFALSDLGHNVIILSVDTRYRGNKDNYGVSKVIKQGVVSYSLNIGPWVLFSLISDSLYNWLCSKFLFFLFKYVLRREGIPDVLYSHYLDNSFYCIDIKKKYKIPLVAMEHWSELGKTHPSAIAMRRGKSTYPYVDKLLVVSNSLKENIYKLFSKESVVVNNIIGKEFSYQDHIFNDGIIHFTSTGNLNKIKGFDIVIKAFKSLVIDFPNVRLTIVGDGPERENLQNLITECSLDGYISMVGRKDRSYIVDLMHHTDVYILSSSSETFGVAAGEALACGVPVIATDCGGPRDFMNDTNGILIPTNNISAMQDAIIYMIENLSFFNRRKIADDCYHHFSSVAIGNRLNDIFNEIIFK